MDSGSFGGVILLFLSSGASQRAGGTDERIVPNSLAAVSDSGDCPDYSFHVQGDLQRRQKK